MGKRSYKLARDRVPEIGTVIFPASCQNLSAVGTERRVKGPTQTVKGGEELARGRVPEVSAVIRACCQNLSAVGTERRVKGPTQTVKGGDELARSSIPERGTIDPCLPSGRERRSR